MYETVIGIGIGIGGYVVGYLTSLIVASRDESIVTLQPDEIIIKKDLVRRYQDAIKEHLELQGVEADD